MLTYTSRWSHARGNAVVPSPWQATDTAARMREGACPARETWTCRWFNGSQEQGASQMQAVSR
jgi:hypothetical protein